MEAKLETDRYRWRRPDGARLILTTLGRLMSCGPSGETYQLLAASSTLEAAQAHAKAGGYVRIGSSAGAGTASRPPRLPAPHKLRPPPKGGETKTKLTPEQQAEIDRRIEAHAARVAAELQRRGGYGSPKGESSR